jgi:hypothetical protein
MTRKEFLKWNGLAAAGLFVGATLPTSLKGAPFSDEMELGNTRTINLHDLDEAAYLAWLARLAARVLVTTLVAKKVGRWVDGCYCNGSTCTKSTAPSSAYTVTDGIYEYDSVSRRFVTQQVKDNQVAFNNMSVPFMTNDNGHLMNVEGPFLAGMCFSAEDVAQEYSSKDARRLFVPLTEISNGGHRFDTNPCYPTAYKTVAGSTNIGYEAKSWGGVAKVTAYDDAKGPVWSRNYKMEFA